MCLWPFLISKLDHSRRPVESFLLTNIPGTKYHQMSIEVRSMICWSRCFLDFSVGVGAFVIGLSQISSFFSWNVTTQPWEIYNRKSEVIAFVVDAGRNVTTNNFYI